MMNKPAFSIIIPVLNETDRINYIIDHIKQLPGGHSCEIIVVDADPLGATINSIVDQTVIKLTSDKPRAVQMNAGAKTATGEILIFLHADTKLPETAFDNICDVFHNDRNVAGAFKLSFDSERYVMRLIAFFRKHKNFSYTYSLWRPGDIYSKKLL